MIPGPLRHELPRTVAEAVAILGREPGAARVLSGGTWLVPELVRGALRAGTVVDLARLDLPPVRREDECVVISATATYSDLLSSDEVRVCAPLLWTLASGITGGAQLRNTGTLVGSACRASPASDVPTALVALDATIRIVGADGVREVSAPAFLGDAAPPDVRAGELVVEVLVPRALPGDRSGYVKLKHSTGSWPIVTAAFVARSADACAALAIGGLAAAPVRAQCDLHDAAALEALPELAVSAARTLWSDVLADAAYRRKVAPVAARRAIGQAYANGATCA